MGCVQTLQQEKANDPSSDATNQSPDPPPGRPTRQSVATHTNTMHTTSLPPSNGHPAGHPHHRPPHPRPSLHHQHLHQDPPRHPHSVLNHFEHHHPNDHGAGGAHHSGSGDRRMVVVPEDAMVDAMGNVHANTYYNETRNHNLSMVSKVTDMSAQIASPPVAADHGRHRTDEFQQYMDPRTLTMPTMAITPMPSGPSVGTYGARERVESTTVTQTKWLWDDFSEKGSVMTTGGSMLTGNDNSFGGTFEAPKSALGSFQDPHLGSLNEPPLGSFQMSMSPTDSAMTLSCGD